jgi:hypothetical protein
MPALIPPLRIYRDGVLRTVRRAYRGSALLFDEPPPVVPGTAIIGMPYPLAAAGPDYAEAFDHMTGAGAAFFLPDSTYQLEPTVLGTGYETDFLAGAPAAPAVYQALAARNLSLIMPAELVYPDPANLPALAADPLAAAIAAMTAATGSSRLGGVRINAAGLTEAHGAALHDRIRLVAPSAPIILLGEPIPDAGSQAAWLAAWAALLPYCDIVGVILTWTALPERGVLTPASGGAVEPEQTQAAADYLAWFAAEAPGKALAGVLQAHGVADTYSAEEIAPVDPETVAQLQAPTSAEMTALAAVYTGAGATLMIWHGAGFLKESEAGTAAWVQALGVTGGGFADIIHIDDETVFIDDETVRIDGTRSS